MSNDSESAICGSGTASTVSAETVSGWHVLKVEGYSQLKELGAGESIKSAAFNIGGHRWYILLYPDGPTIESRDQVGVALCLDDQPPSPFNDAVRVRFKFSLLDQTGEPLQKHTIISRNWYTFFDTDTMLIDDGRSLIGRTDLEYSFLKNDSFQVRCDVTILKKIRAKVITSESPVVPPTDLQRQLGDLLASKVGGDVTFEVQGDLFTAHRYMLAARSPVFMAELFGPTREKLTGHVRVEDMDARVFKIMLHFTYTESLPEIEANDRTVIAQHLLVAADRYDIQRLKPMCEDMLCGSVDISTVSTSLVLAEQHACLGLKAACYEFLKSLGNLKAVMANNGFQHLKNSCPSLLEELLVMVAP